MTKGLLVCALALAVGAGLTAAEEKLDAGLSVERLKRIGPKLKEYVDNDKLAGGVSLVYRRGKVVDVQVGTAPSESEPPIPALS